MFGNVSNHGVAHAYLQELCVPTKVSEVVHGYGLHRPEAFSYHKYRRQATGGFRTRWPRCIKQLVTKPAWRQLVLTKAQSQSLPVFWFHDTGIWRAPPALLLHFCDFVADAEVFWLTWFTYLMLRIYMIVSTVHNVTKRSAVAEKARDMLLCNHLLREYHKSV